MAWPILASLAGQLAGNVSSQIIQGEENRKAMSYQNTLNMNAVRESPLAHVQGLKQAGLSPALANSQGFSAPSTSALGVNAPQTPNFMEFAKIAQEQKLVDAQANLLNAEAVGVNRKNKVDLDADLTFNSGLRGFLEEQANSDTPYASTYRAVLKSNDVFSSGTYTGLDNVLSLIGRNDDSVVKALNNSLSKKVLQLQNSNEFAKLLAGVPAVERSRAIADISKVYAEIFKLSVDSRVSEETIKKTVAETSKILVDMNADYHKDFVGMMKNKDYFGAFMSLGYSALNAAASGAPYALMPSARVGRLAGKISRLPGVSKPQAGSIRSPGMPR